MTIPLRSYYPMIMAFLKSAPQTRVEISQHEMLTISEVISREFAPRFAKADSLSPLPVKFSAQELLAISQEISREFSPRPVENRSSLVLLPVDPSRLHAYWHLDERSVPVLSKSLGGEAELGFAEQSPVVEEQLTLRVFQQTRPSAIPSDKPEQPSWFDVPITRSQCRQDVLLPIDIAKSGSTYSAAIGISHGDHDFVALAYSNATAIPNPTINPDATGMPDGMARFIMANMNASSSIGKTAQHQDITESR